MFLNALSGVPIERRSYQFENPKQIRYLTAKTCRAMRLELRAELMAASKSDIT